MDGEDRAIIRDDGTRCSPGDLRVNERKGGCDDECDAGAEMNDLHGCKVV